MSGHHHRRKRTIHNKEPKKVILIVSEGRKSEIFYIKKLQNNYPNISFHIKNTGDKDMIGNFDKIERKYLSDAGSFDIVFLVFDKDKKDDQSFDNFISSSDFVTIWSNPCFEIWLLLHFSYYQAENYCEDIIDKLDKKLKEDKTGIFYGYDKTKEEIFDFFTELQDEQKHAISHAKKLIKNKKPSEANPGTNFFQLFEMLDNL